MRPTPPPRPVAAAATARPSRSAPRAALLLAWGALTLARPALLPALPPPPPPAPAAAPAPAAPGNALPPAPAGAPGAGGPANPAPAAPRERVYPLARFMAQNQPITLRNARSEYGLSVPVPRRVKVLSARLHLEYTNSISLLANRSQLRVELNDRTLVQAPLRPTNPEGIIDLQIPPESLRPGYNQLRFLVAQHYTEKCEDPSAPELWTEVNPVNSRLVLQTENRPLPLHLSLLGTFFDPKSGETQHLHVAVVNGNRLSDADLSWGALVSQAVALRLEYQPLVVTCGPALLPGADNVVAGVREELGPFLEKGESEQIRGSYLAIHALPGDPEHCLLVVSGRTQAEVSRAAQTLANLTFPFPADSFTVIEDAQLDPRPNPQLPQGELLPDRIYRLADLGFQTRTVRGENNDRYTLELAFPPDAYTHEDTEIKFLLHFAHGAGLRKDSTLNVFLNGRFQRAISLVAERDGAVYHNYQVAIPFRYLEPGRNRVEFVPQMVPSREDLCAPLQEENLLFTLFDDSKLVLPPVSHYIALPALELSVRCAFPHVRPADGSDLSIQATSGQPEIVAAAWTLLGKLAQKNGRPLDRVEVTTHSARSDRHLLVVGTPDQLDPELLRAAPLAPGTPSHLRQPLAALPLPATRVSWWGNVRGWLLADNVAEFAPRAEPAPAADHLTQTGSLGDEGWTMQFESPFHARRVAWLVVANTPGQLLTRVRELIQPTVWESLHDDVARWSGDTAAAECRRLGPTFLVGSVNPAVSLEYRFSRRPWLWLGALLVTLLFFAWSTRLVLVRFKLRHHGNAPEVRSREG